MTATKRRRLPAAMGAVALAVLALWFVADRPERIALRKTPVGTVSEKFVAPDGLVYAATAATLGTRPLPVMQQDDAPPVPMSSSLGAFEGGDAWRYAYWRVPDSLRGRLVRVVSNAGIRDLRAARIDENALALPVLSRVSYVCVLYLAALIAGVWFAIRPYGLPILDRTFAIRAAAVASIAIVTGWTNEDLLRWFAPWGRQALTYGPARMYDLALALDNPPINPMLMALETATACLFRASQSFLGAAFLKAIPVASLIALPLVIRAVLLATGIDVDRARFRRIVLASLCNPALIFVTALWGQTDVLLCVLLLAALCAYASDRPGLGTALFLAALLTKPQALVALPVFAAGVLRRTRPAQVAAAFALALVAMLPATLPHGGFVDGYRWLASVYAFGASEYASASFGAGTLPALLDGSLGGRVSDVVPFAFGFSLRTLSLAALAGAAIALFAAAFRERARLNGPLGIWYFAVSCMTVYWLSTRMHERYLTYAAVAAVVWAFAWKNRAAMFSAVALTFALALQVANFQLDVVAGVRVNELLAAIAPHQAYFAIYSLLNATGFIALLISRRDSIAAPLLAAPVASARTA